LIALPLQLMQIHDSPIRSTCFVRAPQADATGQYRFDWEQHLVMTTGNNRLVLTDLRESEGIGLPLRIGRCEDPSIASCTSLPP
jgi:hypothetical protein